MTNPSGNSVLSDMIPIVEGKGEEKQHGDYRPQRVIPEISDALTEFILNLSLRRVASTVGIRSLL